MPFGFYLPTKAGVTAQWEPEYGPELPLENPLDYPEQLSEKTAGGKLYIQEKGALEEMFQLQFNLMSPVDRDALEIFFRDNSKKALNTFEYDDGSGVLVLVRWMNNFNFKKVNPVWHSGSILLRREV